MEWRNWALFHWDHCLEHQVHQVHQVHLQLRPWDHQEEMPWYHNVMESCVLVRRTSAVQERKCLAYVNTVETITGSAGRMLESMVSNGTGSVVETTAESGAWTWWALRRLTSTTGPWVRWMESATSGPQEDCVTLARAARTSGSGLPPKLSWVSMIGHQLEDSAHLNQTTERVRAAAWQSPAWVSSITFMVMESSGMILPATTRSQSSVRISQDILHLSWENNLVLVLYSMSQKKLPFRKHAHSGYIFWPKWVAKEIFEKFRIWGVQKSPYLLKLKEKCLRYLLLKLATPMSKKSLHSEVIHWNWWFLVHFAWFSVL